MDGQSFYLYSLGLLVLLLLLDIRYLFLFILACLDKMRVLGGFQSS